MHLRLLRLREHPFCGCARRVEQALPAVTNVATLLAEGSRFQAPGGDEENGCGRRPKSEPWSEPCTGRKDVDLLFTSATCPSHDSTSAREEMDLTEMTSWINLGTEYE